MHAAEDYDKGYGCVVMPDWDELSLKNTFSCICMSITKTIM